MNQPFEDDSDIDLPDDLSEEAYAAWVAEHGEIDALPEVEELRAQIGMQAVAQDDVDTRPVAVDGKVIRRIRRSDLSGEALRFSTQGFVDVLWALLMPLFKRFSPDDDSASKE